MYSTVNTYNAAGADAELDRVENAELRGPVVCGEHEERRLPVASDGLRVVPRGDQRLHLRLELRRHDEEATGTTREEPLVQVAYAIQYCSYLWVRAYLQHIKFITEQYVFTQLYSIISL